MTPMFNMLSLPHLWLSVIAAGLSVGWFMCHSGVMRRPLATWVTQMTMGCAYFVPGLVFGLLSGSPNWSQWLGQIILWTTYTSIAAGVYSVFRQGRGA